MKLDLIGGNIVRDIAGSEGWAWWGVIEKRDNQKWRRKLLDHSRPPLFDRLPRKWGNEERTYVDTFWEALPELWDKNYYFEWFNTRVFKNSYKDGAIKRKMIFLEGIVTSGTCSLQALVNDCSFIGGKLANTVELKLREVWKLLEEEYINEKRLDILITEISETIDMMNVLFYTNNSGRKNPYLQNTYEPIDLSRESGLDMQSFVRSTAQKIGSLIEYTPQYATGGHYMWTEKPFRDTWMKVCR